MERDFEIALFERLDDMTRALDRIAAAQEKQVESLKIGGTLDVLARNLRHLADAVNRNTTLGGR